MAHVYSGQPESDHRFTRFSRYMVPGDVPIWPPCYSPEPSPRGDRSKYQSRQSSRELHLYRRHHRRMVRQWQSPARRHDEDRPIPVEPYKTSGCGRTYHNRDGGLHPFQRPNEIPANQLQMMPMQQGDVHTTYADTTKLKPIWLSAGFQAKWTYFRPMVRNKQQATMIGPKRPRKITFERSYKATS